MSVFALGRLVERALTLRPAWTPVGRGMKDELRMKWVRPEVPGCVAAGPDASGDLVGFKEPDPDLVAPQFKGAPSLEKADESVRRLFSIGFNGKRAVHDHIVSEYTEKVQNHKYDTNSLEVKIAKMTAKIRLYQSRLETERSKLLKVNCKELIEKRKQYMQMLRSRDYKRFEWLLEELELVYKSQAEDYFYKVTRKKSLVRLTDLKCEEIKAKKLEAYRKELEAKRQELLKFYAENPI